MGKNLLSKKFLMLSLISLLSISYCKASNSYDSILLNSLSQKDSINPVEVFEQLWQVFNTNYPYFEQQGIDWSALYKVYRAKITPQTTDDELFSILCRLLGHLNNGHINLINEKVQFTSGPTSGLKMEDFSWKLVRDKYLKGNFKSSPDSLIYYGWIDTDVAYLRIRRFPGYEVVDKYFDGIIQDLMKARGIIIEVRGNPGGTGSGVEAIASRFADKQRLFMKNYNRTGASKEYNNITYHYMQPKGPVQFTGPVVLLQNRFSESGSDAFALAIRVLPNAMSIGEFTGGCFATYYPEKLINGWTVSMPWSYATDQNDFCWEGIGIAPNLRLINTKEDISSGNDKVLELAIDIIKAGGYERKEVQGSLNDLRISLVYRFLETSEQSGTKEAVDEFEKLQMKNPDKVYFSLQELQFAVRKLISENKSDQARAILELGIESFPNDISSKYFLAKLYEQKELPEKAKGLYAEIIKIKTNFPWERNILKEAENYLNHK
ncbi:MAG: S41 family peptidase [Bacteroidota bacterium]|nr:S41 family peptidase [Bacteroidota bacterium]